MPRDQRQTVKEKEMIQLWHNHVKIWAIIILRVSCHLTNTRTQTHWMIAFKVKLLIDI